MLQTIESIIQEAHRLVSMNPSGMPVLAVAAAQDREVLEAVETARKEGLARAILVGDSQRIAEEARHLSLPLDEYELIHEENVTQAAATAVRLVREKRASVVMKGLLDTAVLLKAVLNKETGLHAGRLVSHVGVIESPYYHKLLIVTDGAINIAPSLTEKVDIIRNACDCARALGIALPKVALLAALEKINSEKMPCTAEAAILSQMNRRGQIPGCYIDGPLALDNAVNKEAARIKGIESEVAGDADILVAPDIEAGNVLYKALIDLGGSKGAGLVMGAAAPVVLTSRADTAEVKRASIALALLVASGTREKQ
ncbi:MAG TPA: bifunctional enoyl-CoA hydratase/phosphate acetyltransferase [Termitinemataceae bacterium]|nr:bifunctional enoyl-CoA hydratase/phosphate acetyltransferase [Termitinemataceae bacterium]HOM24433.1 bifunctional enoyl-CoA hydratase/phosphate acetyltransferase [Termitinemataceae bacterium]HPQ01548.1 bifunctional enoyl-CoA hydratase/phosphate acetyltransferase [Termitinemataceae bacterium]